MGDDNQYGFRAVCFYLVVRFLLRVNESSVL